MLKMHVLEVTLSVRRLLASLDIYDSNSLNTEVQKQSEALIKKLHTKFVHSISVGIHRNTFFSIDIKFS